MIFRSRINLQVFTISKTNYFFRIKDTQRQDRGKLIQGNQTCEEQISMEEIRGIVENQFLGMTVEITQMRYKKTDLRGHPLTHITTMMIWKIPEIKYDSPRLCNESKTSKVNGAAADRVQLTKIEIALTFKAIILLREYLTLENVTILPDDYMLNF